MIIISDHSWVKCCAMKQFIFFDDVFVPSLQDYTLPNLKFSYYYSSIIAAKLLLLL